MLKLGPQARPPPARENSVASGLGLDVTAVVDVGDDGAEKAASSDVLVKIACVGFWEEARFDETPGVLMMWPKKSLVACLLPKVPLDGFANSDGSKSSKSVECEGQYILTRS